MGRRAALAARRAALVLAAAGLLVGCGHAPADDGAVNFIRNANSAFDRFVLGATPQEQAFARAHYWRMRGYPPFFDPALRWAPPTDFYKDLYALYPANREDEQILQGHPGWVLADASGNRLYVPFGCRRGRCPAFAADVGNPDYRAVWIGAARAELAKGYAGIFIDNVNMELRVGDGSGAEVAPIDPRTGAPMTLEDWRRYVAEFTVEIRRAFPDAVITHNAIWYSPESDRVVVEEIQAADYVELERGFNDPGITAGSGMFGFETLMRHVDWLHTMGRGAILEPYGLDAARREYELASYYLVSNGNDAISSDFDADPDDWWPGWDTDLGASLGARYEWDGVLRRDFQRGVVLVNQPGAPTRTLDLKGTYRTLGGDAVTSATLGPAQGAVLLESGE